VRAGHRSRPARMVDGALVAWLFIALSAPIQRPFGSSFSSPLFIAAKARRFKPADGFRRRNDMADLAP
jgi:hypothetical protein